MIDFKIAAEAASTPEDEDVVEVPIEGVTYLARRPTLAMSALMTASLNSKGGDRLSAVFKLIGGLMGDDARDHIERLVWDRRINYEDLIGGSEDNPDGGLIDQIFAEFTARPTGPSTGSSASPGTGGRKSTGRSPGKGSTRSTSPSTDS